MEVDHNYASKGVANAGLATGITALSLAGLQALGGGGILGGLIGGNMGGMRGVGTCESMMPITRYEADLQAKIAAKDSHIGLLEADKYTDQKIADVYERIDRCINGLEAQICNQAVINAQITANISCMQNSIAALNGLTKTIIPIGNVCPEPMPQYNSWTAPTATT
jgi:hypothetical protein